MRRIVYSILSFYRVMVLQIYINLCILFLLIRKIFCSHLFQKMAYEYIAISEHPDDVISLSIGSEAETYALAHYKGSLKRGLNPSTSGVQPNKIPTTSSNNSITNDAVNKCNQHNENGCSSSSGTACNVTSDEVDGDVKPPERQHMPKRCRSQEAIQRRRRLYKLRKQNKQQKHLNQPEKFKYRELTITRYFQ